MGRIPGFVKWLVAPAVAVAVGFYAVAPMVQGKPRVQKIVAEAADIVIPKPKAPPDAPATQPSVRVDVKPVPEDAPSHPRRRRRAAPSAEEDGAGEPGNPDPSPP